LYIAHEKKGMISLLFIPTRWCVKKSRLASIEEENHERSERREVE
jgi:hypothetical protein